MKKVLVIIVLSLILSFPIVSSTKNAEARTYFDDNYNAYLVATSQEDTPGCLTSYYTKIGDGNAVVTFDLQFRNEDGYFGVIAGSVDTAGNLKNMTDYMLFGKDTFSSVYVGGVNIFESGYTYRVTFNNDESKWIVEKKTIGESDFIEVLNIENTFTSSNMIGLACYSMDTSSATAVIDNLEISDLSGRTQYVYNDFNGSSSIKDGSMKTLVTSPDTGTKIYTGSVYIQKQGIVTVRFMSENGEIISEQNVVFYCTASAPDAPIKDGYVFKCWSGSLNGILENTVFYPIYEKKTEEKKDDEKNEEQDDKQDNKKEKSGCSGSLYLFPSILMLTSCLYIKSRRKNNENIR